MLLAKRVAKLAEAKGCTPGQLALAWVLAQGDDVIPIPGAAPSLSHAARVAAQA